MSFKKITEKDDQAMFKNLEYIKEIGKQESINEKEKKKNDLFILIHGWRHCAEDLKSVSQAVVDEFKQATVIIPDLGTKFFFSRSNIYIIVREIIFLIDNLYKANQFDRIYLVGHSAGALIAKKVYLCAYGEINKEKPDHKQSQAPFEEIIKNGERKDRSDNDPLKLGAKKDWVTKVDRIILLAGISMGWSSSLAFRPLAVFGTDVAIVVDTLLKNLTQKLFIFQLRRGSSFVTNLRFQWLIMAQDVEDKKTKEFIEDKKTKEVLVIQLLGCKDDLVSPQDNIDYVTGRNFYYKDVPNTNHENIIEYTNASERLSIFLEALTYDPSSKTKKEFLSISDLYDRGFVDSNKKIENVVFVIHGIRDNGFWTNRIAREIKKRENNKEGGKVTWMSETSSYGFFGMLPFLFPYLRHQKVEWLMDKYIENRSLYPKAKFHCIGHSNGTYLIAEALDKYSFCQFKHIIFAGSVVRSNYNWKEKFKNKQVEQFLNFVATADWVVAIFPNLFEFPWSKLGGAGHKGFDGLVKISSRDRDKIFSYESNSYNEVKRTIHQLKYIKGDHGSAIQENNWDLLADFIINGQTALKSVKEQDKFQNKYYWIVAALGFLRHPISFMIFGLIVGISYLIVVDPFYLLKSVSFLNSESAKAVMLIAYLSILWQILTRI